MGKNSQSDVHDGYLANTPLGPNVPIIGKLSKISSLKQMHSLPAALKMLLA
jgi:hypothetical protein